MSTKTDPIDETKELNSAIRSVTKSSKRLQEALRKKDIPSALKYAYSLTGKLQTDLLNPIRYYELFMKVTGELSNMEQHLVESHEEGAFLVDELYELVQHASEIIPRLYLLITIGGVYIKIKTESSKDILFDLVELCNGVQHPMRGLFLRNYLSQVTKNRMPDVGTEYEGEGGTITDATEFVLSNFSQMNTLWVRMQHQGSMRERAKREEERRRLRMLVGTNLLRLSDMSGVDLERYQETVLPRLLEEIVNCQDTIAQEYLMDCIIHVFPDEYHLATLEKFLSTCPSLNKDAKVQDIICALMNRLSKFAKTSPQSIHEYEAEMFPLFHKYSSDVITQAEDMLLKDQLNLQVALVNFASTVYPDNLGYVDGVLGYTSQFLGEHNGISQKATSLISKLLTVPLQTFGLSIINLANYVPCLEFLDFTTKQRVAVNVARSLTSKRQIVESAEVCDKLFGILDPIIIKQENQDDKKDDRVLIDSQTILAKLIHLLQCPDLDENYAMLKDLQKKLLKGGKIRMGHTIPALMYALLKLVTRYSESKTNDEEEEKEVVKKQKNIFKFLYTNLEALDKEGYHRICFHMYLHSALASDKCNFPRIAYRFFLKAVFVYEEDITDSKEQPKYVRAMTMTLRQCNSFNEEDYDTFTTKCLQHSYRIPQNSDKCTACHQCAHLFWESGNEPKDAPDRKDEQMVLKCLKKALKIATESLGQKYDLFIELLNAYLYFYEKKCKTVTDKHIHGLIQLIEEQKVEEDVKEESLKYFQITKEYLIKKNIIDA